jgi:hypothetical protein
VICTCRIAVCVVWCATMGLLYSTKDSHRVEQRRHIQHVLCPRRRELTVVDGSRRCLCFPAGAIPYHYATLAVEDSHMGGGAFTLYVQQSLDSFRSTDDGERHGDDVLDAAANRLARLDGADAGGGAWRGERREMLDGEGGKMDVPVRIKSPSSRVMLRLMKEISAGILCDRAVRAKPGERVVHTLEDHVRGAAVLLANAIHL